MIFCVAGVAWTSLPIPNRSTVYSSKEPVWSLKIEQPEYLRAGETATVTVEVTPPDRQGSASDTNAVSVRVNFPGLFQGANEATQMVNLGSSARFPWILGPAGPGQYEGQVWIYNGLQKVLLNVRTIQLEVRGPDTSLWFILRIALLLLALGGFYLAFSRSSNHQT